MDTTDEFRPNSIKAALWKQVDEQSHVCDFTVKVGDWAKRFHSSILVASPFFHCIIDGQYRLCRPATVEFHNTCPASVQMAIMFLYGKCPTVCETNIEVLFDLAEFLMIPNLKTLCVKFAQCIPVTRWNLMHQLKLASLYEFDNPRATEYLHRHLDELLEDDCLLPCLKDFVVDLFGDETLRFVSMDTRLSFLIRWYRYNITDRARTFPELFALLELTQLSEQFLQAATIDCWVEALFLDDRSQHINDVEVIAIIPRHGNKQSQWYDVCKDQWLKPPVSLNKTGLYESTYAFAYSVQSPRYGVCDSSKIEIVDVSNNTFRQVHLSYECSRFENVCANASTVFAYSVQHVQIRKVDKWRLIRFQCSASTLLTYGYVPSMNQMLDEVSSTVTVLTLVVHIGKLNDKSSHVTMEPVFTLVSSDLVTLCMNKEHVCAIVGKNQVVIFDTVSFQLDTLKIKAMNQYHVVPFGDCFVIHDDTTAIFIQKVVGPSLNCRYLVRDFDLPQESDAMHAGSMNYRLIENLWFRQLNKHGDSILERSSERLCLSSITDLSTLTWKRCAMPSTTSLDMFSHETTALVLKVPTETVRCHKDCPHCKALKKEQDTYHTDKLAYEIRYYTRMLDSADSEDEEFRSYDPSQPSCDFYEHDDDDYCDSDSDHHDSAYDCYDNDYDDYYSDRCDSYDCCDRYDRYDIHGRDKYDPYDEY